EVDASKVAVDDDRLDESTQRLGDRAVRLETWLEGLFEQLVCGRGAGKVQEKAAEHFERAVAFARGLKAIAAVRGNGGTQVLYLVQYRNSAFRLEIDSRHEFGELTHIAEVPLERVFSREATH